MLKKVEILSRFHKKQLLTIFFFKKSNGRKVPLCRLLYLPISVECFLPFRYISDHTVNTEMKVGATHDLSAMLCFFFNILIDFLVSD